MLVQQSATTNIDETESDEINEEVLGIKDLIPYVVSNNILHENSKELTHPLLKEISLIIQLFCGDCSILLHLPDRLVEKNLHQRTTLPQFWCHSNLSNKWFFLCHIKEKENRKKKKILSQTTKYIIFEYSGQSNKLISYKPFEWKLLNDKEYKNYQLSIKKKDNWHGTNYVTRRENAVISAMVCDKSGNLLVGNYKKIAYLLVEDKYSKIRGKVNWRSKLEKDKRGSRGANICGLFSQTNYKLNEEIIYYVVSEECDIYAGSTLSSEYVTDVSFFKIKIIVQKKKSKSDVEIKKINKQLKKLQKNYDETMNKYKHKKAVLKREEKRFYENEKKLMNAKDTILNKMKQNKTNESKIGVKIDELSEFSLNDRLYHYTPLHAYPMNKFHYFYDSYPKQHRVFYCNEGCKIYCKVLKGVDGETQCDIASLRNYMCVFVKQKNNNNGKVKNYKKNAFGLVFGMSGVVKINDERKYRYDVLKYPYKTVGTMFDKNVSDKTIGSIYDDKFKMDFKPTYLNAFTFGTRYIGYDEKRDCILYLSIRNDKEEAEPYWTICYHRTKSIIEQLV
eukprot:169785_1